MAAKDRPTKDQDPKTDAPLPPVMTPAKGRATETPLDEVAEEKSEEQEQAERTVKKQDEDLRRRGIFRDKA